MLYAYAESHGVPHRKCGKLLVATRDAEVAKIEALVAQARGNGVEGMTMLDAAAAKGLEPALACVAAALSPETGIVDSHRLMLALQGDIEDAGGAVVGVDVRAAATSQATSRSRHGGNTLEGSWNGSRRTSTGCARVRRAGR